MLCGVMSDPLPVTEIEAFRPAEVKAGRILVPVRLISGEWAAIAGTPSVMRQLGGSVDAALDSLVNATARAPKRPSR